MIKDFKELSNADYHSDTTHLSSSGLKLLLKDPKAFEAKYILKTTGVETKDAFDEGSAVHCLILEPHKFEQDFAIYPGMRRAGKEYEAFKDNNPSKIVLSAPQVLRCQKLVANHLAMPVAVSLVQGGFAEHSLTGKILEVPVKMRADYINIAAGYIVDVKTTSMPSDIEMFRQTVHQYGYDLSAALYCDIAFQQFGKLFDFFFITLSKADGGCNVYKASSKTLSGGASKVIQAVVLYKKCVATGIWKAEHEKPVFDTKDYEIEEV